MLRIVQTEIGKALPTKVIFKPIDSENGRSLALKSILKEGGKETAFILTPDEFSKVFSPERLKLLILVRRRPDLSISDLSKNLDRKREAVSRDIRFFEGLGLIRFQKRARTRIPSLIVEEISIRL